MMFFDPDRLHDILFCQKVKPQILTLLKNAISTRGIFDNPFPIVLIERKAVGGLSPWADNWSGKMFDFLKKLSRTHILDDGYLNGSAYGFEPEYTADLPQSINLESYHLDTLTIRIPANSEGVLTWLQRTHDPQSAPYSDKLTNKLCIAMRRHRRFKNTTAESQEFTLSTRNWLHNSVCFQGVELVGVNANQSKVLLYDQTQSFLDFLWGELNIPNDCKVLTGMTVEETATAYLSYTYQWFIPPGGSETINNNLPTGFSRVDRARIYKNAVFKSVPASYSNATLLKAGDGSQQGAGLVFAANSSLVTVGGDFPDQIEAHFYENPNQQNWFNPLENVNVININYPDEITLKTTRDFVNAERLGTLTPIYSIPYFGSFANVSSLNLYTDLSPFYDEGQGAAITLIARNSPFSFLEFFADKSETQTESHQEFFPSPHNTTYTVNDSIFLKKSAASSGFTQYSLPPSDDYGLFDSGEVVWLKNSVSFAYTHSSVVNSLDPVTLTATGTVTQSGAIKKDIYAVRFLVDAETPSSFSITQGVVLVDNAIIEDLVISNSFSGVTRSYPLFVPQNFPMIKQSVAEVSLERTFRQTPLSNMYKEH